MHHPDDEVCPLDAATLGLFDLLVEYLLDLLIVQYRKEDDGTMRDERVENRWWHMMDSLITTLRQSC